MVTVAFGGKETVWGLDIKLCGDSNHVHLIMTDVREKDAIPQTMQLIVGRTGQEYNQRKNRRGAFWEDRYHATAGEADFHLSQCMVYVDLNMVRAGVVTHPSEWPFCGFNEIQNPRQRNSLIDHERLIGLFGVGGMDEFKEGYRRWVPEGLESLGEKGHREKKHHLKNGGKNGKSKNGTREDAQSK